MMHIDSPSPRPARLRRLLVGVSAAAGLFVVALPTGADAARRTTSEVIADRADAALEALDRWNESRRPADYVRFVQRRDAAAHLTASELEIAGDALAAAWESSDLVKQRSLLAAMSQLGVPYRTYASEEGVGFDCSGLTSWSFGEAGVEIPRISRHQINEAEAVELGDAEAGDLVYYPGHVGIYLGAGAYVHSPNSGNDVEAAVLPEKSLRFGDIVPEGAALPDVDDGQSTSGHPLLMDWPAPVTQ